MAFIIEDIFLPQLSEKDREALRKRAQMRVRKIIALTEEAHKKAATSTLKFPANLRQ